MVYNLIGRIIMGSECSKTLEGNKLQHETLGIVQLLPNPQGEITRVRLRRPIENPQRFHDWQREIRLLLQQDFTEVFYLPEHYEFKQEGMCGNSGVLELEFQYYKFTLKSQIASRAHNHMPFYETELWYLLYNILQAAFLMEPLGKRIGDLHPSNIVLNEKGRVKMIPTCLFPGSQNSYQKMVESQNSDVYLAPEEIDDTLLQRGIYPNVEPCKAEVFSIGLTMLMAASLLDSYDLYDRPVLTFNSAKKKEHFNQVAVSYSTYFCSILNQLLQQNPQKRRAASDFFRELNRFQDDILSFREFNLIQNKLKEGVQKDRMDQDQASIAELLTQRDQRDLRGSQTSIIQSFKSF